MKESKKTLELGHGRSVLKGKLLRFFRVDNSGYVGVVGQTEAQECLREEIKIAGISADKAKANALMEWQKHRRLAQII